MTQITNSKGNIVEKLIRDKAGRLVRARFFIYENAGRIKARLLDFTYIEELTGKVLSLSSFIKQKISTLKKPLTVSLVSPFIISEILYSSGSKPRAPTF